MKERPILVAVIGYIIGILWGLYFRFSIVLCYILILTTFYIVRKFVKKNKNRKFKLLSFNRYSRYLKLMVNSKVIFILIILSSISNSIVLYQNNQYENTYQEGKKLYVIGIVMSQKIEKQYYNIYQVKLLNVKQSNILIQVNKNISELECGDKVQIEGEYKKPSEQRNYGGYDDKQYLKTLKVIGRVKVNQLKILEKKQQNIVIQLANVVHKKIKEKIEDTFKQEEAVILKGLLLGETSQIQEEVKEDFQIANISHVLAISGMHISYIIIGIQSVFKRAIGKKKTGIVTIVFLFFYVLITGFSPSIVRAVVMGSLVIGAKIVHRKNDIVNAIAISLLVILIYNPFLILNVGLQFSYLGIIGIILFHSTILKIMNGKKLKGFINKKIKEMIAVTLSAQITILPISIYHFNIVGVYFLITNLMTGLIMGPIMILGFFSIFLKPLKIIEIALLKILYGITNFSKLPFSKIYLPTLSIISIILYFILMEIAHQIYKIYHLNHLTVTQQRVKNIIALFRYKFQKKRKIYLGYIVIVFVIISIITVLPKDLRIHFVDVGQGDCTFIITPCNKTILIDGGGSLTNEFDVGKKTLIPYLLDRGYTSIDYIMVSHFDQDHVRFYPIFITRNKSEKCYYRKAI